MTIPSSAIRLYTDAGYSIPAIKTSKLDGALIYPKIVFPYTDSSGIEITSPYTGRLGSSGVAIISSSAASSNLSYSISGIGLSYSITSINATVRGNDILLESGMNHVSIIGMCNSDYITAHSLTPNVDNDGNSVVSPILNISAASQSANTSLLLNPDYGAVKKYAFEISFDLEWWYSSAIPGEADAGYIVAYSDIGGTNQIFKYYIKVLSSLY